MHIALQYENTDHWLPLSNVGWRGAEGSDTKRTQEALGGDGYVYCLESCDGFTDIYTCQNLLTCPLSLCSLLYSNLFLNKICFKKMNMY